MKAFLTSHHLEQKHFDKFRELLKKSKSSKALFIITASVPYGLNPRPQWLEESLSDMSKLTKKFDETSLEKGEYIPSDLKQYDFIFLSGGDVFYLAYRLAITGLDKKIKEYIKNGGLYSGSSAGAIILMDNIEHFALVDDPTKAPKIYSGLGLIDFAIVPHADNDKYLQSMKKIVNKYKKNKKEVILLNDNQVLVITDNSREVI